MGQRRRDREWPKPDHVHHVWVQSPEHHQPPDPGLVVEWRRSGDRWFALTLVVLVRSGRTPIVLQRWYHQDDVTPAPTEPRSPDPGRWHLGWKDDPNERHRPPR